MPANPSLIRDASTRMARGWRPTFWQALSGKKLETVHVADDGITLTTVTARDPDSFLRSVAWTGTLIVGNPADWRLAILARWVGMRVIASLDPRQIPHRGQWCNPAMICLQQAHLTVGRNEDTLAFAPDSKSYPLPDHGSHDPIALAKLAGPLATDPAPPPRSDSTRVRLLEQLRLRELFSQHRALEERRALQSIARDLKIPIRQRTCSNDRPRVLFVSHDLTRTGGPMALYRALLEFNRREINFDFHILGLGPGPMEALFQESFPGRFSRFDPVTMHHMEVGELAAIDGYDPDLVVLNGSPLYQEALCLHWKGIPVLWWFHDGINVARKDGEIFRSEPLERMVAQALACCPRITVPARDTVNQLEILSPAAKGRIGWIPNGLDVFELEAKAADALARRDAIRCAMGVQPNDIVFLCVGSFEPRKNQRRLVQAFQRLVDRWRGPERSRFRLVLIGREFPGENGAASYLDEVRAAIRPELRQQILLPGPQPGAEDFLVAADCHVLVSTNEGSPLVNLEAMILNKPCISSRVHGIPEVVQHGMTGYLVNPEDLKDISRALLRVARLFLKHPGKLSALAARAKQFVIENHRIERTADELQCEISRQLENRNPRTVLEGEDGNALALSWLTQRWAMVKGQSKIETHLSRMTSHRLHQADEETS